MNRKPDTERQFNRAADRDKSERERLIRQLSAPDQLRVERMRHEHEHEVLERRQLQGANRADHIRQHREHLVREQAQPALRPNGHTSFQRSASDIDRIASKSVDDRNRHEIADMAMQRDKAIDHFLEIRGQTYDQFKGEREQLIQQRESTRENNNVTREI
jgi:hypothetical protein